MSSISRWLNHPVQGTEMVQHIMAAKEKRKRTSTKDDIKEMEKKESQMDNPNLTAQVKINTTRSTPSDTTLQNQTSTSRIDIQA